MEKRKKSKSLFKNKFWRSKIGCRLRGRVDEVYLESEYDTDTRPKVLRREKPR